MIIQLVSKIYRKIWDPRKQKNSTKNGIQNYREFSKDETQMADKHFKMSNILIHQ